jgi:hypothetical protein
MLVEAWKIVVATENIAGGSRFKEYFLVAIPDQVAALIALRQRLPHLIGADFEVLGQASPEIVEWLDLRESQILTITAIS